jgi:hypothetical protein
MLVKRPYVERSTLRTKKNITDKSASNDAHTTKWNGKLDSSNSINMSFKNPEFKNVTLVT